MENKFIKCVDCGQEFCFSPDEQQFYKDRVLADPKRCPKCRAIKKMALKERQTKYETILPVTK